MTNSLHRWLDPAGRLSQVIVVVAIVVEIVPCRTSTPRGTH
ncbi:hypothetical protein [Rhodococcus sovatensis]|uniref:Uncharacterized protein n=1 Tax=Rhodococcus sovatensis TaxID=1805840 RepID=A0ABZ2PHS7_9NOCA